MRSTQASIACVACNCTRASAPNRCCINRRGSVRCKPRLRAPLARPAGTDNPPLGSQSRIRQAFASSRCDWLCVPERGVPYQNDWAGVKVKHIPSTTRNWYATYRYNERDRRRRPLGIAADIDRDADGISA